MNSTMRPWSLWISLSTALSRSSNSPRNLLPAISAPRSSATTRLSLRLSGTSPETMRCASPSTIAVFPTPGSPISTGLFLVRRESTWTTRRISSSRPITGSSLPARAIAVRSRLYFASAWYFSSGFSSVTRWPPRTCWSDLSSASAVTPARTRRRDASFCDRASARLNSRCSTETNSSLSRCASLSARSSTSRRASDMYIEPPVTRGNRPSAASASVASVVRGTPSFSSTAAIVPSGSDSNAASRCSGASS